MHGLGSAEWNSAVNGPLMSLEIETIETPHSLDAHDLSAASPLLLFVWLFASPRGARVS